MTRASKAPAIAMVAMLAVRTLVHSVLAMWTPLTGADWDAYTWAARHGGGGSSVSIIAAHATFAKLVAYAIARSQVLHVIGTPFAGTMLVVLLFVIARRRLPGASWSDVLDVAVLSTLLWVGQPRFGLVQCYRPDAAMFVWGGALALAVIAPVRCGWRVRGAWLAVIAVAAIAAGATAPQLSLPALVYVICAARRAKAGDARWIWLVAAGLAAGAAIAFAQPPYFEIVKVVTRGLEPNFGLLSMPLREEGQLIALVAALALIAALAGAVRASWAGPAADRLDADEVAELAAAPRWLAIWLAMIVLALMGPQYREASLLPSTAILAIAALPFVRWLARGRVLRALIVVLAIVLHAWTWASGLALYADLGDQFAARAAALTSARPGAVAVVAPYSELRPGFWFYGEDWQAAATRELIARDAFALADIEIAPGFRTLERSPHVGVALESTATPAQLAAADAPRAWPRDLGVARVVFERFAERLAEAAPGASARIVTASFRAAELGDRPVAIAWLDAGAGVRTIPKVRRAGPDPQDRYTIAFDADLAERFPEAWLVGPSGPATRVDATGGHVTIAPMAVGTYAIVACDATRCLAVDAFVLDL